MTFNIDMAVITETKSELQFDKRSKEIYDTIMKAMPDIICLQELRLLDSMKNPMNFINLFTETYGFEYGYRNAGPMSFGQYTLFKKTKFASIETKKLWLSSTPHTPSISFDEIKDKDSLIGKNIKTGSRILGVKLMLVENDKYVSNYEPFWIWNCHFPMDTEEWKNIATEKLYGIIKKEFRKQQFILCGDFNTYYDREGNTQRKNLSNNLTDCLKEIRTLDDKIIGSTWLGWEYDSYHIKDKDIESNKGLVDGIYVTDGIQKIGNVITLFKYNELLTNNRINLPSDHIPLLCEFNLTANN